jgi:hypothetical protein
MQEKSYGIRLIFSNRAYVFKVVPVTRGRLSSAHALSARAGPQLWKNRRRASYWFTPLARNPPSTTSTSPVTKEALSEAR